MKWEIFKKNMQSNLNQHSSEVDINQIWGNIEGEVDALNQESQKKRVAWLLFLILGVGLAGGLVLWSNSNSQNVAVATINHEENSILADQKFIENSTVQKNDVSISASVLENSESNKSNTNHQSSKVTSVEKSNVSNAKKSINKTNPQSDKKERKAERNNKSSINKNTFVATTIELENSESHLKSGENKSSNNSVPLTLNTKVESSTKSQKTSKEFADLIALAPAGGIMLEYHSVIPKEKGELIYTGWSNPGFIDGLNLKPKKKGFSFYLDVNAGYSIPKQSLSAKGETETEYLQFRRDSEKLVAASQFGANFIARHSSGFEISTGIRRTSVVQKFEHTYSYVFTEHINQVSTVGEEIIVEPQLEITYRTFVDKKYYSKYNYLEIPLMVGYHLDAGKFNFGIQSGVYASLLLKTNGTISDITGEQTIDIANDLDERYTSKFGIGYAFGLSFGYDLHKRLAINFSPTVQYNPTDYSAASHNVAQKHLLFGGNVGLNIQLSR